MKFITISVSALFLVCSSLVWAEPLKVKPGLWETTTTTEKKSAKQPTNLDKLTKEQRAKVERKLAERIKKESRTVQACLNEAQLSNGEAFLGKTHQGSCKRMIQTQTATNLIATVECTGANSVTGRVEMHATDEEHMSGTVTMTYGPADKMQLRTNSDISARWLGSDCSAGSARTRNH
jgi:hypothetical protein